MYKVVFHIDETEKWKMTIANITNLLKDTAGEIDVVVNGAAVKGYLSQELVDNITNLHNKGVKWYACRNALQGAEVMAESLPDFVQVVQTGVLKIIKLQQDGYAYIKP